MRLQKRQYVLIVLIIAVGSFNFYRIKKAQQQSQQPLAHHMISRGTSPAWPLFDNEVAVRDASDEQFQPALKAFTQGIDSTNAVAVPPQTSAAELTELHGCQTWLLFYRAEHLHPTGKPGWLAQTQQHVDSCLTNHRDIAQ